MDEGIQIFIETRKKLAIEEPEPPKPKGKIGKGDLESRVVKKLRMLHFCALERER